MYGSFFAWKWDVLTGLSGAILISGTRTYISIKFATLEIAYIIQHLATGAEGAPLTPQPSLPGLKNTDRLDPGLLIQNTAQMNLLDPKERLEATQMVAGIMDYLESEGPAFEEIFQEEMLWIRKSSPRSVSLFGTLSVLTCHWARLW